MLLGKPFTSLWSLKMKLKSLSVSLEATVSWTNIRLTLVNILASSLRSRSQNVSGGWRGRFVGLTAIRVDPFVVDEVAELAIVLVQPEIEHYR